MTSTFMGLEIGRRGLQAHQQALHVTGHNLSNVSTPGFSRQRVEMSTFEPIFMPHLNRAETAGQLGQGSVVERVERARDQLLDRRIVAQSSSQGFWAARDPYIRMMERLYLEPGANSVRSQMDAFWDAWQELAMFPADAAPRTAVIERGRTLIDGIHNRYHGLKGLQDQANSEIELTVDRLNEIARQIADLNGSIQRSRAMGDMPNDLMDRRDLLVDRLASIVEISIDTRDPDEFMVHTAGHILVQGEAARQFELRMGLDDTGYSHVFWQDTGQNMRFSRGSLGALLELRDHTIAHEIRVLDNMTMNFVDMVNEIHREAYGLNGSTGLNFFSEFPFVPNAFGNFDRAGTGEFDSSFIYRISGQHALDMRALPGLEGTITLSGALGDVQIQYFATDTVADIMGRINGSGAEVVASLGRDGRLSLRATPAEPIDGVRVNPDFVIRHVSDTGHFLTGYAGLLGDGGAFDWGEPYAVAGLRDGAVFSVAPISHPSGWIEVNPAIARDPLSVASGFGENGRPANPGNGDAAQAIASIRNTPVMVGRLATFDDYFADAVGRIGLLGEQSGSALATEDLIMRQLEDMRQSISGVNIDEELSNMLRFQHGYNAAARFITTVNQMLDVLMRMGA